MLHLNIHTQNQLGLCACVSRIMSYLWEDPCPGEIPLAVYVRYFIFPAQVSRALHAYRHRPWSCTNSATVLMIAKDFAAKKSRDVTVNTLHSVFMIKWHDSHMLFECI